MTADEIFELRAELRRLQVAVSGLEVIANFLADKILGKPGPRAMDPCGYKGCKAVRAWHEPAEGHLVNHAFVECSPSGTDKTAKRKRR